MLSEINVTDQTRFPSLPPFLIIHEDVRGLEQLSYEESLGLLSLEKR